MSKTLDNKPQVEITVASQTPREAYLLAASLIAPRPIAWVSSLSAQGLPNLAPFSFFTMVSGNPPMLVFSVETDGKDTLSNVRATGQFVVNLASVDLAEKMDVTAIDFPPTHDEFWWARLTPEQSRTVMPARIAEAPAALECRLHSVVPVGDCFAVFGEILHFRLAGHIYVDGRVDTGRYRPLSRLAGRYAELKSEFRLSRPSAAEVARDEDVLDPDRLALRIARSGDTTYGSDPAVNP